VSAARLIAVVGGSASGKTRLAEALCQALGGAPLIAEDDYYVDAGGIPDFDPSAFNFDEPAAKDHDLLAGHLADLKAGRTVNRPDYDFATHRRRPETVTLTPHPLMVAEGLHLLCEARLRVHFDLTVYVDAPEKLRLGRRLARDIAERGRSKDFVLAQFESRVAPMHDLHIEPCRDHADLIVENHGAPRFEALIAPILERLRTF
jgi:uridine kinase